MLWSEVIADPTLRDLPYKVELNEWGTVLLSPASNKHGLIQAELTGWLLIHRSGGRVITECSVETPNGVKVADVAWCSAEFFARYGVKTPYPLAPDLCIEIISPSNSNREIEGKISLYLAQGAREVWVCNELGQLRYFDAAGALSSSRLFAQAPDRLPTL